ncbi:MAG: SDR family NAD(P)-dependent oxidoreductase [Clostridia bacterium]|nr:SDR family NAD(P)-dependent oxidoreductase [Clostridia bacterium]
MKNIIVTGAYGGMGNATVKLLAKNGYRVFALDKVVFEAEENVFPVAVDVCDLSSVMRAFETVKKQAKSIFAIVNFAGIYRMDSLVEMSEERFTGIFDVNVFGAYRINKTFLPLLEKGGRIIITSSELAPLDPLPFTGIYGITKTALEKYAYSLRMELQLLGIKVCVLRPGAVKTKLLGASTKELDEFCSRTKLYSYNAEKFKRIVNKTEAKNVPPEKVAEKAFKAIKSKRPKYVYNLNRNPLLRLLNFLPKRTQNYAIRKILKSKDKNKNAN